MMPAPVTWAYGACLMNRSKLRRQIAWEAARLMYSRQESEYYTAKMKAAQQICQGWVKPADLPSNVEIRDQIQAARPAVRRRRPHRQPARDAAGRAGDDAPPRAVPPAAHRQRAHRPRPARLRHRPARLLRHGRGGHAPARSGRPRRTRSSASRSASTARSGSSRTSISSTAFRSSSRSTRPNQAHYVFKSSITGKAIERASIAELRAVPGARVSGPRPGRGAGRSGRAGRSLPGVRVAAVAAGKCEAAAQVSSGRRRALPQPAGVRPRPRPAGLRRGVPAAALLHDVGKAIDPADHVAAGLEALDGFITERTAWLIEHHMLAHQLADGTLGARASRRLAAIRAFRRPGAAGRMRPRRPPSRAS